jgi:hypothetical protein
MAIFNAVKTFYEAAAASDEGQALLDFMDYEQDYLIWVRDTGEGLCVSVKKTGVTVTPWTKTAVDWHQAVETTTRVDLVSEDAFKKVMKGPLLTEWVAIPRISGEPNAMPWLWMGGRRIHRNLIVVLNRIGMGILRQKAVDAYQL